MRSRIRVVAALLIAAILAVALFAALSYLRERDYYRLVYAHLIESQDVVDAVPSALAALENAVVHGQNYVLTGDSAYSKAWVENTRQWQDETGTLALLAEHDKAPLVKDFTSTGDRALKELGAVVALYDGNAGDKAKALDGLRKGAGVADLDRAREIGAKFLTTARRQVSHNGGLITNGIRRRRVAASAAALFCLALIGAVLLLFDPRRAAELRSTNPAGSLPDRA